MGSLYLFVCAEVLLVWPLLCGCADVRIVLTKSMLEFKKNGLYSLSPVIEKAFDDQKGTSYDNCSVAALSGPVWLEIDLGQLYSLTKIALLSRRNFGKGAQVYVGQTAVSSVGITDYRCGSSVTIGNPAPSTLTDFGCDSTNWVRYVSIRRSGNNYLTVCEVEAYYNASEDPGVFITRNGIGITALNVTKGDIVKCGSSEGEFGVTWRFPNGTVVSNQTTSPSIRQAINSTGYQDLILSPLTSLPPNGPYTCEYTANGMNKTKSLQLNYDVKISLTASMLKFKKNDLISHSKDIGKAVDGRVEAKLDDANCPRSAPSQPTVWLEIDLGQLYSLTNIALVFRAYYGRGVRVYVGQTAVSSDGFTGYRCGSSVTIGNPPPSTLTDFGCNSTDWVRYVSIRRNGYNDFNGNQYLAVCEVEAYYNAIEDPGVSITRNGIEISALNVTVGDIVKCGSSKGDFGVTWRFPNGTVISTSPSIRQAINSTGYQDLALSPLTLPPPHGQYTCEYTANGMKKTKSLQLNFDVDCQLSAWSACSRSCGRGKRTRKIIQDKLGNGKDCTKPLSEDCSNVTCLLDLIAIKATATQGPGTYMIQSTPPVPLHPSLAIDSDSSIENRKCAAPGKSTNPWLRIDLQSRYIIKEVQVQFYDVNGGGDATVNIGNSLVNNGTNNTQCGLLFRRTKSEMHSFVCSPSLWGRYIILQKTFSPGSSNTIQVCDVQVYHELEAVIVYNGSSVVSGSVFADPGVALPYLVTCGVNPDPTGLNALLNIEWKTGNKTIPQNSSSPQADVAQTEVYNQTNLEIKKAPSNYIKFVCHYTWIDNSNKSLVFDLLLNANCGWSAWLPCSGSCGVGSRKRTPNNPAKKYSGKKCIGISEKQCDAQKPPCAPTPIQSYVTANEGTQPALQCSASQYHTLDTKITFQWFKVVNNISTAVDPSLGTDSEKSLGNETYTGSFVFKSVNKTDAGEYTCNATGAHGQSNFSMKAISLNVTYVPYDVKAVQIGNSSLLNGTVVRLECQSDSNPVPHIYLWSKDGTTLSNEKSILSLSLDFRKSGNYICSASNSVGSRASPGLRIRVIGPPGRCVVNSTVEEVMSLYPSCFDGNSPITGYKVRYRKKEEMVWSQNNSYLSIPIQVTGLSPYTDYELAVAAENLYGYGEFSDVVAARTPVGYPSAPLNVTASPTGPFSIEVAWFPPVHPNGPIDNYVIFIKTVSDKRSAESMSVNVGGSITSFNLTSLTAYTLYIIELAALNTRTHDSKVLTGSQSKQASARTSEAAPTAPVELSFSPDPPRAVNVSWKPPLHPNGIIRNFTLKYQISDGTGDAIVLHLGMITRYRLENLKPSTYYNVSIHAVTISPGPTATLQVIPQSTTPGSPFGLLVESKTSESLYFRWSAPVNPNGIILGYEIVYRIAGKPTGEVLAVSLNQDAAFNLTGLDANTNYSVSVKTVNDAKGTTPKSRPAVVSAMTLRTNPVAPDTPAGGTADVSMGTITLTAPAVSSRNGPISYVKVIVYMGDSPPNFVTSDTNMQGNSWNEAAYFTFDTYEQDVAGKEFIVGSGVATSDGVEEYTNQKLEKDAQYSIYFVVYGKAESGTLLVSSSKAFTQIFTENQPENPGTGGGNNTNIIIAVVIVIIVLVIVGIVIGCVIGRRRRSAEKHEYEPSSFGAGKMSLSAVKHVEEEYTDSAVDKARSAGMSSPEITSESLSLTVYEGTTALLPCDATGDPLPVIKWYNHSGKSLPGSDTRFHRLPNGSLQITAVRSSDSGSYRCAASNKFGTDEQSVELTVKPLEVGNRSSAWSGLDIDTPSGTPAGERKMRRVNSGMHAVVLDEFPEHVSTMHELNDMAFSKEFKVLGASSTGMKLSTDVASANPEKNRYKNILTYDHARVVLKSIPGMESLKCDYIAAAYIDGYSKPNKYIASQGPTKSTCADMWRMIWGEDVRTIVMVTNLVEGNKIKCHRYWPEKLEVTERFEGLSVTLEKVDAFAEYDIKTIVVNLGAEGVRTIKLYHFISWPDHGVPKFATSLLYFIRRVNRELPKDAGPMLIHCSAGVGRTGTFVVIDQMLEKIEEGLPIDIFSAVTSLRTRRQDMVQAESQYIFIHDALMEAVLCGNTQIPVHNLRTAFAKLSRKDKKDRTGFERQYLVLQSAGPHFDKALCKAGFQHSVSKKNRYPEIVPLDTERVVLRLEEEEGAGDDAYVNTAAGANYINASYIDGYHRRDAYIVTQGPLKNTVDDFWKMVWEQNSFSIVNLTELVEDGQEMCSRYWPESGFAQFGAYKVEILQETPSTGYTIRKMHLSKGAQIRTVCQFHFSEWPEKKCPKSAANVLEMMMQVEKWQQVTGNKVITVHCNNGIGRSGVFCALTSLIDSMKVESVIDVFYKVKGLRIKRPGIVQNVDQYTFCYQALLDYTDRFDTYANFK